MVQQGGELAYLLLHDPEYAGCGASTWWSRQTHSSETDIGLLFELLQDIEGPPVFLLRGFGRAGRSDPIRARGHHSGRPHSRHPLPLYDEETGEIRSIDSVPAGYGKVAVLDRLRERLNIGRERVVYVGDGISDVHVMLHVSRMDGLTIAVSENKFSLRSRAGPF